MATTQEVFDHHVGGFVARDVSMVLEDYTDDSVLISNGKLFEGTAEIGTFYSELFDELPADCQFALPECVVRDRFVYIVWNGESDTVVYDFATDTFVVENGKVVFQTVGFVKRSK